MVGSMALGRRLLGMYIPLSLFLIFLLFPFYWMLTVSFKPTEELFDLQRSPFVIQHFTLDSYTYLFRETAFESWVKNTLIVATASTAISLFCSILIGYALARLRFPGSNTMGIAIFLAYLVPPTLLFLPLAQVVARLDLYNTYWALVLTYPTQLIPFASWTLMGYFRTIAPEVEESAMIDGCSRLGILVKIILPLALPGVLSAGIFAFTLSWNEFIYALTFVSSSEVKTVPVGVVTELVEGDVYHWGALMAGALLGSLPVAVMYSFFVEYYVAGITGAVKE